MKFLTILVLCFVAMGCGYGSHSQMPATPGTAPIIAQLMPAGVAANSGNFNLTVTGSKFSSGAFVTFNNAKMSTTWTNSGQVIAAIPNSAIMSAGNVPVIVTNPASGGGIYGGGMAAAQSNSMMFMVQ